ncbi:hypothetical protein Nepgr_006715 [Nepenthes gracilis]|uniref:Secreted protein n=1 Tax=Nepenthes gracilis TaxID=150966 RepID=A0AAD3XHP8_NEPGR|nr:hypothetical protein Nepgr_006715 [Nepenthes gracilis]
MLLELLILLLEPCSCCFVENCVGWCLAAWCFWSLGQKNGYGWLLGDHPHPRQVLNPSCEPVPLSSLEASTISPVVPTLSSSPSTKGCTPSGSQIAPEVAPIGNPLGSNLPSSHPRSFVSPPPLGRILSSPSWADKVAVDSECSANPFALLLADCDAELVEDLELQCPQVAE